MWFSNIRLHPTVQIYIRPVFFIAVNSDQGTTVVAIANLRELILIKVFSTRGITV